MCGCPMEEDVRGRDMTDKVLCKLLTRDALLAKKGAYSPTNAYILGTLAKEVNLVLGAVYNMVGVMREGLLEVWHITEREDTCATLMRAGLATILPPSATDIYRCISSEQEGSPWALASMLVSQIAADIIPATSHMHLKYGLLLSLVTQGLDRMPVGVVAVGSDAREAYLLMDAAANLADRRISARSDFLEGSIKEDATTGLIWEEAGDFILSSGGVCLMGDWSKYRRRVPHAIESLDTGVVTLDSKLSSLPAVAVPLRACVWTNYGYVKPSTRDNVQLRSLINMFGMPFLCTETDAAEYDALLSAILTGHVGRAIIPAEDLRQVLRIARSMDVHLTPSASDLIKEYFVSSRRDRPGCLPQSAIRTITSLAEAHARLSLRTVVLPADVALVIYLYQQTIETLFGSSQLNAYSPSTREECEPIYKFMHRQMQQFNEWLDRFLINNL